VSEDKEPLRIFVAMPGTRQSIGGDSVPWPDPEAIKNFFFEKIAIELQRELQRECILQIEKDKHLSGPIYDSMFAEAWQSDVYIADLTGNNANVYLELGVRWALKDNVTIVVSQDIGSVRFNASYTRAIAYSNDHRILEQAIVYTVKAIKEGLADKHHIDSPVRSKGDIIAKSKDEVNAYENRIHALENELESVITEQGLNLINIAENTQNLEQRIDLYQRAIQKNPALIDAYLPLAEEQRKQDRYEEALMTLEKAIGLFPNNAGFFRVQGVIYKKKGLFEKASESLHKAVKLNEEDGEAWSNLGGLLREMGTQRLPFNWDILHEARNSYQKALELNKFNAYAQGNIARLDLLLSKKDPERKVLVSKGLSKLEALSRLELEENPTDYWISFDQADSYLLVGEVDKGYELYTKAIALVPLNQRKSELSSVISPLEDFLVADVLDAQIKIAVEKIIEDLKLAQIKKQ
jgi:tetratricopeptide (TPR) repeat protein